MDSKFLKEEKVQFEPIIFVISTRFIHILNWIFFGIFHLIYRTIHGPAYRSTGIYIPAI